MRRLMRVAGIAAIAAGLTLAVSGCGAQVDGPPPGGVDYQLGVAYDPPADARIVVRDRTARPTGDRYDVCYVNAFQTQPGERGDWPDELLLRTPGGDDVVDPDWPDEVLLDTRASADQDALVDRVTGWIDDCARAGFDAVEFDNLDTYSRSDGVLSLEDALAIAERLVAHAHGAGLAAAQKNAAEDAEALHRDAGFDFAVVEECAQFDECGAYRAVYGDAVVGVEYTDAQEVAFDTACAAADRPRALVLRDRDLVGPTDPAYERRTCPES